MLSEIKQILRKYIYYNLIRKRLLRYPVFPSQLWIENTNCCNASCVMCPREKLSRKQGFMELHLFEKLIAEASRFKDILTRLHLHNFGEPLLDKELFQRIQLAKNSGIKTVYLVTNAALLLPEKSREIILSGLDELKVSFYGTDPETYNATMVGLDFEKAFRNINNFLSIRRNLKSLTPRLIVQYLPTKTNKCRVEEFSKMMRPLLNKKAGDSLNIFQLHNYGDGRLYVKLGRISRICHFPWHTMVVLYDGNVVLCSPDYNGIQVMGNVYKNTIQQIWLGEYYAKVREDFKRFEYGLYPVCLNCTVARSQ